MKFEVHAIRGLFKSLKVISNSLCHGAPLEQNEPDIYSSSKKCVKEKFADGTTVKTITRHIDCNRIVTVNSLNSVCKICSNHKQNRKQNYAKALAISDNKENIDLESSVQDDLHGDLRKIAPNMTDNQITLIAAQIESSQCKNSKGMRWPKEVICMALTLYNRNPSAYRDITKNGWLNLPSESLLYLYKSVIKQKPGIIPDMMAWMRKEALRQNIQKCGFYGGIILDEMAIQEDLQIVNQGKQTYLHGLVDCEPDVMLMHSINEGKIERKLANHVMQYMFHGLTGFRWPFANYPNAQACPADIFISTWKCIDALYEWVIFPIYCCMDGSSNNRSFLKMHFSEKDPLATKMVAVNYKIRTRQLIFIMDPCHFIKKLRNSVLSSGIQENHKRLLSIGSKTIQWQMWIDAFNWDQNNHSFKVHHKLTNEHIFPNNAQKMRNQLAFDTLNLEMLNLVKTYSKSLGEAGQAALCGAIEFLENSSFLVSFFTDKRPVKDMILDY